MVKVELKKVIEFNTFLKGIENNKLPISLAYSKDGGSGTHPDETGHKIIAPRFKGFLETLLF